MDNEGYPEQHELDLIEAWPYRNVFGLMQYIKERWNWGDMAFKVKWIKYTCQIEMHTGGWSGNESLVNALLKNEIIPMWHTRWERGGHYWFEIPMVQAGYATVKAFSINKKISKQAIHKYKEKYDWLDFYNKILFVRDKPQT